MAPTRRKPIRRKTAEEGIGATSGALSVDVPACADAPGGQSAEEVSAFADAPRAEGEDGCACTETEQCGGAPSGGRFGAARIVRIALVALLALIIAAEGGFCLWRWAPDDAADVQGTWYVNGSDATITITAESIVLADDVAYGYAIDEGAKTMTYTFGIMEGAGRYRFSLDREQLAIMDGEFTFADTLMADISWTFEALLSQLGGEPESPAAGAGENTALLTRAPASEDGLPVDGAGEGEGEGAGDTGEPPAEGGEPAKEAPAEGETSAEGAPKDDEGAVADDVPETDASAPNSDERLTVTDKLVVSDKPQDA